MGAINKLRSIKLGVQSWAAKASYMKRILQVGVRGQNLNYEEYWKKLKGVSGQIEMRTKTVTIDFWKIDMVNSTCICSLLPPKPKPARPRSNSTEPKIVDNGVNTIIYNLLRVVFFLKFLHNWLPFWTLCIALRIIYT